jgi:uncharacterized C2H2 Zn-finger protein
MKDVKYQTIRTVLNANKKLVETKANTIPLTHLYRTSQSYTGHLNLIQDISILYRTSQSYTEHLNLIQGISILYRTSQSYTGHLNLISWYHIYICTFVFDTSVGIMYIWIRLVLL